MEVIRDRELHEECGVFGIYGVPNAASLTYYGLHALQHRGQEGAGIVSVDESGTFRRIKGGGLVTEVFDEAKLATLKGSTAIGHVRYTTAGGGGMENVQPFLRRIQTAKADAVVRFFGKKQHISGRGKADDRSILRRIERFFAAPIIGTVQDVLFPEHIYAARSRAPTQKRLFRIDSQPFAVRGLEQCQFAVDAVYFIVPGLQPCRGIGIVCRIIHADLCEIRCVGRQYIRRFGFPWRFHRLRCW